MIGSGIIISSLTMRSKQLIQLPIHDATIVPQCFLNVEGSVKLGMFGILNGRIIDIILVVMVVVAKIRRYRAVDTSPFINKVFHEATVYFGINFIISVMSTVFFFTLPGVTKMFCTEFMAVTYRCLACRMIVRLREEGMEITSTQSAAPVSGLHFQKDEQDQSGLTTSRV